MTLLHTTRCHKVMHVARVSLIIMPHYFKITMCRSEFDYLQQLIVVSSTLMPDTNIIAFAAA